MTSDIKHLDTFMKTKGNYSATYELYDKVYSFTTENQRGYMTDSSNQDVLSVAGSGDHYLNLSYLNASRVDSFDINKFALYHLKLKKAAVMALSKEEFYDFLGCDAKKYYDKVSSYLDMDSLAFWDYYMLHYINNDGFHRSRLFLATFFSYRVYINNHYLQNNNYQVLKQSLSRHHDEDFYHTDIYDLPNILTRQYDSIYLSNISNYQTDYFKFLNLVITLYNDFLKKNGKIYYGYFYGAVHKKTEGAFPNSIRLQIDNAKGIKDHHDYVYVLKKN